MVAPAVRYFWQKPVQCNARHLLFRAQWSLERGSGIEAGCLLLEAMRAWLLAECKYYHCIPKSRRKESASQPSPRTLAVALKKAGHCSPSLFLGIVDIVKIGNEAVCLVAIQPDYISAAIHIAHLYLDGSPYLVESTQGGRS